jgi:hypothetical protein
MAHTAATVDDLEVGNLPPVCAKTGEKADTCTLIEFTSTPDWTWILLLFGIFPFLIARYFAKEKVIGQVPMNSVALRWAQRSSWATWGLLGLAVALFLLAIPAESDVLAQLGIGTFVGAVIFAVLTALFMWPRGHLSGEWVHMSFVDKRFAQAVDRWYEDRA